MALPQSANKKVDRSDLLADFAIPATVDFMLHAIETDIVNEGNFEDVLFKICNSMVRMAEAEVTPDTPVYVRKEDGIPLPQVKLIYHTGSGIIEPGNIRSKVIATPSSKLPSNASSAALDASSQVLPLPTSLRPALAEETVIAPRTLAAKVRSPSQERSAPSLTIGPRSVPARRASDKVPALTPPIKRIDAMPEPAFKLPRGLKSINEAIRFDVIVCLEDGKKVADLAAHLATLGMTPAQYIKKWKLSSNYPMRAPKIILSKGHLRHYQVGTQTYVPVR